MPQKTLLSFRGSNSMFLHPAKWAHMTEKEIQRKIPSRWLWGTGSVMALSERWKKNDFDRFQSPRGPGSLFQPQPSYCSHHHSKHTTLLCRYISSSVQPPTPNRTSWDLLEYNARTRSGPNQWSKRGSYIIGEKWYCFSGKPQHCRNTHQLQSPTQNTGQRKFSSNKDQCEGVAVGHVVC